MQAVYAKIDKHFAANEWYLLKRAVRADGRKERVTQRTIFVVMGVLVVILACWMLWGDDDPHGWAGALWMGLIAALSFRIAITQGDDPED